MRAMASSLSIAVVTHAPDERLLARTLASAAEAVRFAKAQGSLAVARLQVVDNGPDGLAPTLESLACAALGRAPGTALRLITGQGNVGFAQGHNLAIADSVEDFHLILNPDVEMSPDAIHAAIGYLEAHPEAGAITPSVLFVRGFVPRFLHGPFRRRLDAYELRHLDWEREHSPVPLASGCFLFCRAAALDAVHGFDPGYFLYFEDFDLTLRLSKVTRVAYCPQVRIVHHGGEAASKGWRHIVWFARSARRFFAAHGWR
jgi:GT2 family glycosyltransferase